jgi:hypothetical protein
MSVTLSDVTRELHDALSRPQGAEAALEAAMRSVSSLAEPGRLTGLLTSMRAQPQALARCAALSYAHPLGFDKLVLIDAEPRFMLRIHAWWPDSSFGAEHVHNHRFGFATAVVHGDYDMYVYERSTTGMRMTEYREQRNRAVWQLDRVGPAQLQLLTHLSLPQGSRYALSAHALHRVAVTPGKLCITLFLETQIVDATTRIFIEPGAVSPRVRPKNELATEEFQLRLDAVLAALNPAAKP